MNSLDFYLALLCGCKRDVARVAVKVGGLTDCVFTGLCGALPEAKGKGDGVQGAYSKAYRGILKAVVILCLFALTARQAEAVNCIYSFFQKEKINVAFCQNHLYAPEIRALLYKAKTMILNDYIKDKIAKGELQDKKFEIQIRDETVTPYHFELTQGRNGYFVSFSWFPTLRELKTIVDYFSSPDWKPFVVCDFESNKDFKTASKRVYDFFKQYTTADTITYQPFTVWEKDGVSLQYANGSLRYLIDGVPLPFKADAHLPVKIQDRHLFFQQDSIFVVQDMQIIKKIKRDDNHYDDINVQVHSKWVNICWHVDWIFSYSYDNNKFYKNPNKGIMTMTTAARSVRFDLAGFAAATIDWGDGSEIEKVILNGEGIGLSREYSNDAPKKITITGKHVHELWCQYGNLIQLDVSRNTALRHLTCSTNQLTTLDVSRNTALYALDCGYNQLTTLDVSKNTLLKDFGCSNNTLTTLDLSQNTVLWFIQIQNNQFNADALNDLFKTLHDNVLYHSLPGHTHVTMRKRITIGNNPGTTDCNRSIAEQKGWEVNR